MSMGRVFLISQDGKPSCGHQTFNLQFTQQNILWGHKLLSPCAELPSWKTRCRIPVRATTFDTDCGHVRIAPCLGILIGIWLLVGRCRKNGQPTVAGFDTFFDKSDYVSYVEFGSTTSKDWLYLDNVHVTLWHSDAHWLAGTPKEQGIAFTAQEFVCDKWLPFPRYEYSDGDAAMMQSTFSNGLELKWENNDVARVGFNWGKPADGSLREQFTS